MSILLKHVLFSFFPPKEEMSVIPHAILLNI